MDSLTQLIERYRTAPKVKQIAGILQKTDAPARLQLNGLMGAQESFVLAGAYANAPQPYLIIAIDKDEAAYVQNDLQNLMTTKTVHYLPDSFKRPTYFEEINSNNVLQRTEVINKLAQSTAHGEVIVTYPEALFEKVVAPQYLEAKRISITVGENLDVDFMAELFIEFGFLRKDFVYEPGQFSIRGGIVDVYSYGNEYPYRIELFDIEVESIRTFDPTTQLSQQKIRSVNIVPNINTRFDRSQKTSILSILPENTVIFTHDFQNLIDRLQICFDKAEAFGEKLRYESDRIFRQYGQN